mmetsp:Transcript_60319/g.165690  ORF Transcript_60319/g.165690 Transcript_60319/m.165690 type:complete len:201 (+) Transcript_60319:207-809(+)
MSFPGAPTLYPNLSKSPPASAAPPSSSSSSSEPATPLAAPVPAGSAAPESHDMWRESLLRYMGYANEVGEAFRYQAPGMVIPSYLVAFGYVCGDARDKGLRASNAGRSGVYAAADCFVWQSLASVAIPGLLINQVVAWSRKGLAHVEAMKPPPVALPKPVVKWTPTALGLCAIPLIIRPIDHGVDFLLDSTTRRVWGRPV